MLFVSDVHAAVDALRRLVRMGEPIVVLGDLANLTDYRTGEGAVADVLGIEFARSAGQSRGEGDFLMMRRLWTEHVGEDADRVRREIAAAIDRQYVEISEALGGGQGYVMHGNVDRPGKLIDSLPTGFQYVHGDVIEVDGLRVGFVGGGVETPLHAEGEVSDDEMEALLEGIGRVDVLCTHVPPFIPALRRDVITGREERGSEPVRRYLLEHQPPIHLYGDVHQAQATTWRLHRTRCHNAGYFRATGRYLRLGNGVVEVGHIGYPRRLPDLNEND